MANTTKKIYNNINMRNLTTEQIDRYKQDHTFTKYFFFENMTPNTSSFLNIVLDGTEYKLAIERLTIRTFVGDDYKRNRNTKLFDNLSYRVVILLDGSTNIYVDDKLINLDTSWIFLQSPGKQLSVTPKISSSCTIAEFYFDLCSDSGETISIPIKDYLAKLFGLKLKDLREFNPIDNETQLELKELFFEFYNELINFNMTKLDNAINMVIFRIFNRITQTFRDEIYDKTLPRLHNVINLLEQNYSKTYTIDELAKSTSLSKHYFQNLFKQTYGVTPIEYLTTVRIKHAKFMLSHYQYSVSEIAYNTGFNNPYYFSRVFKQHTALSPREYRKQYGVYTPYILT